MGGSEADDKMTDGVCIAAFLAGLLGSMGFGGGSVLIIYLTLFLDMQQKSAQGINLVFFIPCALISIAANLRNNLVRVRTGLFVTLGGIIGAVGGSFIFTSIDSSLLGKIFGGFVTLMGVITLLQKNKA